MLLLVLVLVLVFGKIWRRVRIASFLLPMVSALRGLPRNRSKQRHGNDVRAIAALTEPENPQGKGKSADHCASSSVALLMRRSA